MRVALVHSPYVHFSNRPVSGYGLEPSIPPLGISALAGYLRRFGNPEDACDTYDLNIELATSFVMPSLRDRYGDAVEKMRTPQAFDLKVAAEYQLLFKINNRYAGRHLLRLCSAIRKQRWDEVEENPLGSFLRPHLETYSACDVVGFSALYPDQLVPAAILALLMRRWFPGPKIVFGGTAFKNETQISGFALSELADHLILGDGEEQLLAYLTGRIEDDPTGEGSSQGGRLIENLEDLPPPFFDQLFARHRYVAPSRMILLAITRGCYWGRCRFCDFGWNGIDGGTCTAPYRKMTARRIVDHIESYRNRLGVERYYFLTDVTDPGLLENLANELMDRSADIHWQTQIRFEPEFANKELLDLLKKSGCCTLVGGMESRVQRVSNAMRKGIDTEVVERFLETSLDVGIHPIMLSFMGFPTETPDESVVTFQFLLRAGRRSPGAGPPNEFMYYPNAPIGWLARRGELPGMRYLSEHQRPAKTAGMDWDTQKQQFYLLAAAFLLDPAQLQMPIDGTGPLQLAYYSTLGPEEVARRIRDSRDVLFLFLLKQSCFRETSSYIELYSDSFDFDRFLAVCEEAAPRLERYASWSRREILDFIYPLFMTLMNCYQLNKRTLSVCKEIARFEYYRALAAVETLDKGIYALPTDEEGKLKRSSELPTVGPVHFSFNMRFVMERRSMKDLLSTFGDYAISFRADGLEVSGQAAGIGFFNLSSN